MISDRYPDIVTPGAPVIEQLSGSNLRLATHFAICLADNRNFHHFRHTLPEHMLNDKWEAYMMIYNGMAIAWGQIEKFPHNPHKQHVCRLGFAVLPEYRKNGLGGKMMDYIIDKCRHFEKLTATVFLDNVIMLSMFINRGFIIEGCFRGEEKIDNKFRHVVSLARYGE